MWYMKLLWIVIIFGSMYILYAGLKWLSTFADDVEVEPKDSLRSITLTYKPSVSVYLAKPEITEVMNKLNEKLKRPFGSLTEKIDIDDIISITTIPLPVKGVIQFTIWYREKYRRPAPKPYGGYNIGRTGGNAYTKDTKPFWAP